MALGFPGGMPGGQPTLPTRTRPPFQPVQPYMPGFGAMLPQMGGGLSGMALNPASMPGWQRQFPPPAPGGQAQQPPAQAPAAAAQPASNPVQDWFAMYGNIGP